MATQTSGQPVVEGATGRPEHSASDGGSTRRPTAGALGVRRREHSASGERAKLRRERTRLDTVFFLISAMVVAVLGRISARTGVLRIRRPSWSGRFGCRAGCRLRLQSRCWC
jgi:hypothetical protein